jgi:amino acid adenylation domain-containing protein/non-ribosomal peptide synthase protein (TIGR01720 family)
MKQLLSKIKDNNILLEVVDGKLKVFATETPDPALLNEIREKKDDLLRFLSENNQADSDDSSMFSIPAIPQAESYRLSASQWMLWVASQFSEANVGYNISDAYVFRGHLDLPAFSACFNTLVERHENLRTVFRENEAGEVRQFIRPAQVSGFSVTYHDLQAQDDRHERVDTLIQQYALEAFNLAEGPLLRADLFRLEENKWVFSYVMHHIISDGWSMGILIKELLLLYNARIEGRENPLSPLRIQYKDYTAWQLEQLSDKAVEGHRDWWLRQFEGELPVLELWGGKPRPGIKTYNGASIICSIGAEPATRLKSLCREQGATLYMGLVAVVDALLHRYTGQEDIVIGSPIAGRQHPDLEDQIGFYVNTLAFRARFSGNDNFRQLLDQVKQFTMGAYAHQVFPFAELVEALKLQRDPSRSPIFDVQVILGHADSGRHGDGRKGLGDLEVSPYEQGKQLTSRFDIVFNFAEREQGLGVNILYNPDVYTREVMVQLSRHLEQMLDAITASPDQPLVSLDYLAAEEKRQLLQDFHGRKLDYDKASTFLDLFAAQVQRVPDQVALSFENVSLTYKELDEKANQLANYLLQEYSLQPDDLVGIMVDRSEKMILALLAVQKAGAAYVPIEPDYPDSRKEFIITDTGIKVLLTQSDYMFDVGYFQGGVFALDVQLDLLDAPFTSPEIKVEPHHLAYVIYTSGSTGNPKGVLVEHRNLMHSTVPRLSVYSGVESFLLLSSIAFDSSVAGVFGTLAAGGRLCITRKIDVGNVATLSGYIARERITHLLAVPSYYKLLLAELAQKENSLKQVIVAGEACPAQLVEQHHAAETLQGCELFNEYGPTEGSVWSTYHRYSKGEEFSATIGKAVPNVEVYILGNNNELLPAGVMGEICIAGGGLARGYLNRPELTEQKFVPHPFHTGERMYRTGDAGRWMPDGSIEFLGRRDDQVKIRGYRIELGEVENAIRNHPSINEAVVIAKANEDQVNELVAYIVSGETLTASDLQTYLEAHLPSYAVPAHFVQIEQLPLTSNGKVDKKKLPDPKGSTLASGTAYVAPRTEIEECLVAVYEEVLKRQPIGIKEDFFALGGDSIKSIQIVSRVKQRGYSLNIQDILLYPTIESLAPYVKLVTRQADQGVITGEIPLSPIQHWFLEKNLPAPHHYNQSVLLFSGNPVSEKAIRVVFDKLVLHHDALRMVYRRTDSGWVQENKGKEQGYSFEVLAYDEATFLEHCERIQSTIDLQTGPLFKVALFRGSDGDRLLMVAHHLVIDGVSWRILFEDISTLYQQYTAGIALVLPEKTDSFKYWQEKQMEYALGRKLAEEEPYWSGILLPDMPALPVDNPQGGGTLADTELQSFLLDAALTDRLLTKTSQAYRTEINDILLTALGLALEESFGLDRVLIEMEGHGREDIGADVDISRTVGWFTTTYPVLFQMSHKDDIIRQLVEVKEALRRVPNKGIGYGVLRYMAGKKYNIEPEIAFNYLGDFGAGIKTEGGEALFEFSGQGHGKTSPDNMSRDKALNVLGMIAEGQLRMTIGYSKEQFEPYTIYQLVEAYRQHLETLIEKLSAVEETHITPADLTYKGLSMENLKMLNDSLVAKQNF